MINYNEISLSSKEKLFFCVVCLLAFLVTSRLFYDNYLFSLLIFPSIRPLKKIYCNHLRSKRKNELLLQFKDLLYSLSSLVCVGRSIGQALEESIEFWKGTYNENDYIIRELKYMSRCMNESRQSDISVLQDFADRSDIDDIRNFADACKVCKEMGGDMTKAISKTADIIGEKINLERELMTIIAQKKFEGRIVASAPFVLIFFIKIFSPEYLLSLTSTFTGHIVTTLALLLIAASWIMIERINKIDF